MIDIRTTMASPTPQYQSVTRSNGHPRSYPCGELTPHLRGRVRIWIILGTAPSHVSIPQIKMAQWPKTGKWGDQLHACRDKWQLAATDASIGFIYQIPYHGCVELGVVVLLKTPSHVSIPGKIRMARWPKTPCLREKFISAECVR